MALRTVVLLLLLLWAAIVTPACLGSPLPPYTRSLASAPPAYAPVIVQETYAGELQNGTIVYVTLEEAFNNVTRTVAGVRLRLMWDAVTSASHCPLPLLERWLSLTQRDSRAATGGNDVSKQLACGSVGATVKVACAAAEVNRWMPDKFLDEACMTTLGSACTADDLATSASDKLAVMQDRLSWVRPTLFTPYHSLATPPHSCANAADCWAYWQASARLRLGVKLKSVQDSIDVDPAIVSRFGLPAAPVTSADVVIIATARPVLPSEPTVAGYAACLQADHWNRCTVGAVNFVPAHFGTQINANASVVARERAIAMQQLIRTSASVHVPVYSVVGAAATCLSRLVVVRRSWGCGHGAHCNFH